MDNDCTLAEKSTLKALYKDGGLVLVAEGDLPTPCWGVQFEPSLLTVEPPTFELIRCSTAEVCVEVVTPYRHGQSFQIGEPRTVVVHHAGGREEVPVETATDLPTPSIAGDAGFDETGAIGYSRESLEAAIDAAIHNLKWKAPHADAMLDARITESGKVVGGIAGFSHYYARVQREGR